MVFLIADFAVKDALFSLNESNRMVMGGIVGYAGYKMVILQ